MDWGMIGTIGTWAGVFVSAVIGIVGLVYGVSKFYGKICRIEEAVLNLSTWAQNLIDGKAPVCARHEERLDAHDRELEDHGRRIVCLEQHRNTRHRPG